MNKQQQQFSVWYVPLALMLLLFAQDLLLRPHVLTLSYDQFLNAVRGGAITEVVLDDQALTGSARADALAKVLPGDRAEVLRRLGNAEVPFSVVRVNDPDLVPRLEKAGVRFAGRYQNRWLPLILSWLLPALVFFAIWSYVIKRMGAGGGMMAIGKSKARIYVETDTKVTFADVAGADEAKQELQEVVEFLKDPKRYGRLGAHVPKGVLLVGPPGTGKTLLARAVAGEAGVPFFSISGSEFVELFVGVGAARVRDLFQQARAKAPAIIFIDELDALGKARGAIPGAGHDEKEQTLNQLLVEMDGFDPSEGLVLLGATNRPEILDPALLRAGRFDRRVLVDRPDKRGRVDILKVHLKKVRTAPDVDPEAIAALTPGFTGADLANLVNEAALLATRRNADAVAMADFTAAVERLVAGLEKKSRVLNAREREVVAHHEMGHALVAMVLPDVDPVHKVSIIPRGIGALGYTMQRPTEDRFLLTRHELENRMAVMLGGRAAEHLVYGELSTGAADDLARATDLARSMVTRYGMDPQLGHVVFEEQRPLFLDTPGAVRPRDYSENTAAHIDRAVHDLVQSAFDRAVGILAERRDRLLAGAQRLLAQETLSGEELRKLLEAPAPAAPSTAQEAASP
ncbi:MAG: ATP-dependent zinc metalloprotease FtsH [Fulvimonas sp.]|nr:ATP-dependent zinc metalloprotease FtsH [Fulvimonas sp.]